jgi:hypothetical protein
LLLTPSASGAAPTTLGSYPLSDLLLADL